MPYSRRDRIAYWLERRWWGRLLVLRYDGHSHMQDKPRYINRLNGHLVVR